MYRSKISKRILDHKEPSISPKIDAFYTERDLCKFRNNTAEYIKKGCVLSKEKKTC